MPREQSREPVLYIKRNNLLKPSGIQQALVVATRPGKEHWAAEIAVAVLPHW